MTVQSRRKTCRDMAEVRAEIDALDRDIVALLADRLHFIGEAARIKASRDAVRDEPRIEDVVAKVIAEGRRAGLSPDIAEQVWRTLIEASIAHEFEKFDQK